MSTVSGVLVAAADLAEDQETTDQAVTLLLRYFGAYPDAYDFPYRALRTWHRELSAMASPAELAEFIRWVATRAPYFDAMARWTA